MKMKNIVIASILFMNMVLIGCSMKTYNLPPDAKIVLPESNTAVYDSVIVKCLCSDDNQVEKVELWIDAEKEENFVCTSEPYEFILYATDFERGQRIAVTVRAYDDDDNFSDSDVIYLSMYKVDHYPSVEITYPTEEIDVEDSLTVVCNASDDSKITKVELLINGSKNSNLVCYEEPYEFKIYAEDYYNSRFQLVARAYDDAYQYSNSEPVYINISNNVPNEIDERFENQYIYLGSDKQTIYRFDLYNSELERLVYDYRANQPFYMKDLNKIGYRSHGSNYISTMDLDGSNQSILYDLPTMCISTSYCAETGFLYTGAKPNYYDLASINIEKNEFIYLTRSNSYNESNPSISKEGNALIFQSDIDGQYQIYNYNFIDSTITKIANQNSESMNDFPKWSKIKDGFYYRENISQKFYLKYYDLVTNHCETIFESDYSFYYDFSSNEDYIAITQYKSGIENLYIFDINNANLEQKTFIDFRLYRLIWVDLD